MLQHLVETKTQNSSFMSVVYWGTFFFYYIHSNENYTGRLWLENVIVSMELGLTLHHMRWYIPGCDWCRGVLQTAVVKREKNGSFWDSRNTPQSTTSTFTIRESTASTTSLKNIMFRHYFPCRLHKESETIKEDLMNCRLDSDVTESSRQLG